MYSNAIRTRRRRNALENVFFEENHEMFTVKINDFFCTHNHLTVLTGYIIWGQHGFLFSSTMTVFYGTETNLHDKHLLLLSMCVCPWLEVILESHEGCCVTKNRFITNYCFFERFLNVKGINTHYTHFWYLVNSLSHDFGYKERKKPWTKWDHVRLFSKAMKLRLMWLFQLMWTRNWTASVVNIYVYHLITF